MLISGTYYQRLLFNVAPYTVFGTVLIGYAQKNTPAFLILFCIGVTMIFWLLDTLILYFKKIQPLKIDQNIYFGKLIVIPQQIQSIKPITDNRYRWSFKIIVFIVCVNGINEKITVMDKPMTVIEDIFGRQSKTLRLLFKGFPELKSKLALSKND